MAHLHSVYDTDLHFAINPLTRTIKNESTNKVAIVQYDHHSERFTFELPRYIEGHDMSLSDKVEVHFVNIASNKSGRSGGIYEVTDLQVSPEDENVVIFSWLIPNVATKYAGQLSFCIRFTCESDGRVDYVWSTFLFDEIKVVESLNDPTANTESGG